MHSECLKLGLTEPDRISSAFLNMRQNLFINHLLLFIGEERAHTHRHTVVRLPVRININTFIYYYTQLYRNISSLVYGDSRHVSVLLLSRSTIAAESIYLLTTDAALVEVAAVCKLRSIN